MLLPYVVFVLFSRLFAPGLEIFECLQRVLFLPKASFRVLEAPY